MGAPGDYSSGILFKMECVTPVHVGIGRSGGVVDLPVMRDEFGFPFVHASSLKGAIKSLFHKKGEHSVVGILGRVEKDENNREITIPSEVVFLDAQLISIPVRSLYNVFAFATSPFLIYRLWERFGLFGKEVSEGLSEFPTPSFVGNAETVSYGGKVVLAEEFEYKLSEMRPVSSELLSQFSKAGRPIFILPEDDFKEIVDRSLFRVTRVELEEDKKVVRSGHLWSEEYVPQWTYFHTGLLFRDEGGKEAFEKALQKVSYTFIIGGKETIGKGIVRLSPI